MAQGELEGELSFATVPQLLRQADALLAGGILDLSRVTRVDSAGLALLLELSRRSKSRGARLGIRGADPQILRLAGFFGLDQVLHFE
ncbi:MAG: STAS domain-containing protein [Nevskia sp.]|nr:STAS domain-containing protein [Nevskia sp.]